MMSNKTDNFSPIYNAQMALYRTRSKLKTGQLEDAKNCLDEAIAEVEQAMRAHLYPNNPSG